MDSGELAEFIHLQEAAVDAVTNRFYEEMSSIYISFGERGRKCCREDIQFTLDFLRPAIEFGFLQSFIDYLRWLTSVLSARGIAAEHIITSLDWLEEFFSAHASLSGSQKITRAITAAKTGLKAEAVMQLSAEIDKKMPLGWPEYNEFKEALLQGDSRRAAEIFDARLKAGASFLDVELHLVQPALYQVGRDWQENRVSVAQEHLATATAITLMAQEFSSVGQAEANGKKAVFACIEGNEHDVGLRIVADAFEPQGWDVQFLGANIPTPELVEQVKCWVPDLLGLSVAFPHQLRATREAISQLHNELGKACPAIMVGGLAFNALAVAPTLGADVCISRCGRCSESK